MASPKAWDIKICVALAILLLVGMTMYKVISLTMDQLQFNKSPKIDQKIVIIFLET